MLKGLKELRLVLVSLRPNNSNLAPAIKFSLNLYSIEPINVNKVEKILKGSLDLMLKVVL